MMPNRPDLAQAKLTLRQLISSPSDKLPGRTESALHRLKGLKGLAGNLLKSAGLGGRGACLQSGGTNLLSAAAAHGISIPQRQQRHCRAHSTRQSSFLKKAACTDGG